LLDTTVDPEGERRRVAEETQKVLLASSALPSKGAEDAAVTLVVFSAFQCSFCKRLADEAAGLPMLEASQTRLIFKHRPLTMHKWARPAALASICANLQGNETFWNLHDFLFARQGSLTDETLISSVNEFLTQNTRINLGQFQDCLRLHQADAELLRDEALADRYHVNATPTLFINGVRRDGVGSPEDLLAAIRFAIEHSRDSAVHAR
jgi:protein-disulfide isomerase